ncbi:MAG: hypothetical protein ABIK09_14045 [Pseudomonadota bacterium]
MAVDPARATKEYLELNVPSSVKEDLKAAQCDLWESIYMSGIEMNLAEVRCTCVAD